MLFHITADQLDTAANKVRIETITPAYAVRVGHGVYSIGLRDASFRGLVAFVAELADDLAQEDFANALVDDIDADRVVIAARLMGSVKTVTMAGVAYRAISAVALSEEDDDTRDGDDRDESPVHDDHAYELHADALAGAR
jgi:hypothetical protein